jgi:hypothetical protein
VELHLKSVRFEVFTAVTIRNGVFWDVAANVVPSSQILFTLMIEALSFSEPSVLKRVTRRNIPEDEFLLNLKSDFVFFQ